VDHVVGPVTVVASEGHQLSDPFEHRTLLRRASDGDTPSSLEVKEALISKDVQRPEHRVLVHPEDGRHILGQRQALAWPSFSLGDCPSDLCGYLVVQCHRFIPVDIDIEHSPIHTSTMVEQYLGLS